MNGEHTYSGKPLLANDTHLELDVPCIWYMAHLTAPGWNVKGFALPGVPLVIIGQNEHIAWGFTNNGADVQDLYIETFNPENPREYKANGKWVAAELRKEVIHVKGAADLTLEVTVTRHGPVVLREGTRGYALRWTATEPGGLSFGYPWLGQARNWEEFRAAMRHVTGPAQNAVYADVDGNIGYQVAANIPVRKNGHGEMPVAGDPFRVMGTDREARMVVAERKLEVQPLITHRWTPEDATRAYDGILRGDPETLAQVISVVLFTALLFLGITLVFGSGEIGGVSRWLDLSVFPVQPSELAKVLLILALSAASCNLPIRQEQTLVAQPLELSVTALFATARAQLPSSTPQPETATSTQAPPTGRRPVPGSPVNRIRVPVSTAPAGPESIDMVTPAANVGATFPSASSAVTTTAGVIATPDATGAGCTVNNSRVAVPPPMLNAALVAPVRLGALATRV